VKARVPSIKFRVIARGIFILLALAMTACGFNLRSTQQLPPIFDSLHVRDLAQVSPLATQLRATLTASGVSVVTTETEQASHVLELGNEEFSRRTTAVNSRARAAQYDLHLSVNVSLISQGEYLLGPERLYTERSYYEDIANISGSNEALDLLQQEMRQELIEQLLRRLRALTINTL
jgi:LPS-assembly lipoprotein